MFEMSCHRKRTGLRRVYVGIGSLVCIHVNLLIPPIAKVLMRLGC